MTTLLRLKRQLGESSLHALAPVKRARTDGEQSVFQYVGTMAGDDTEVPQHVISTVTGASKRTKHHIELKLKKQPATSSPTPNSDTASASVSCRRQKLAEDRRERRFRVVSDRRRTSALVVSGLTLIDVAENAAATGSSDCNTTSPPVPCSGITCNGQPLEPVSSQESVDQFVYDLYLCSGETALEHDTELTVYGHDPFLWEPRGGRQDDSDSDPFDDSDSNAENHWRNDYPDEGLDNSDYLCAGQSDGETEMDLIRRLQERHLSSSSEDDEYDGETRGRLLVYSDAASHADSENGAGQGDAYQRYKRRVLRRLANDRLSHSDDTSQSE